MTSLLLDKAIRNLSITTRSMTLKKFFMQSQVSETEKSAVNRQKCIMQHATIKYLSTNGNQIHKKANLRWGKIGQYARKQKDTQLCFIT